MGEKAGRGAGLTASFSSAWSATAAALSATASPLVAAASLTSCSVVQTNDQLLHSYTRGYPCCLGARRPPSLAGIRLTSTLSSTAT